MSIRLMAQVWEMEELKGSELLVMLSLADHANDQGICWPSQERLAKRARISRRQAIRVLQNLKGKGYFEILEEGNGRGNSTMYRVTLKGDTMSHEEAEKGDTMSHNNEIKGDILSERVTFATQKGDIAMSHEPSIEPSIEPSVSDRAHARTRKDFTNQMRSQRMLRDYDGIDSKLHVQLTNEVKRIYGMAVLIDNPGTDDIEEKMRAESYRLWQLGYNTVDAMKELGDHWDTYAANFTDATPKGTQLYDLAIRVASGNPPQARQAAQAKAQGNQPKPFAQLTEEYQGRMAVPGVEETMAMLADKPDPFVGKKIHQETEEERLGRLRRTKRYENRY